MRLIRTLSALVVVLVVTYGLLEFMAEPQITGRQVLGTQLVIVTAVNVTCNTTFEGGWNLVSFPCLHHDEPATDVLNGTGGYLHSAWAYDASDASDPWKSYNPNLPSYVIHDLSMISKAKGYYLNLFNQTPFYYDQQLTKPSFIGLAMGWNLIGYPNESSAPINTTFEALIPDYEYIYALNATTDDLLQFTWNTSLPSDQDLYSVDPYYGYWIYMTDTGNLVIN